MSDAAPQGDVQASALLLWLQKFDLHESDTGDNVAWPATLNDLYNPGKLQQLLHAMCVLWAFESIRRRAELAIITENRGWRQLMVTTMSSCTWKPPTIG